MSEHSLVWFRGKDLRLSDHAPLLSALQRGHTTLLFVVDPYFFAKERAQKLPHRMQFLLESLQSLEKNVKKKGGEVLFVRGKSIVVVPEVVGRLGATRVLAHRWTEPFGQERDVRIARSLEVPFDLFEGETLLPPESVRTNAGDPYAVFTPFGRAARELLATALSDPLPAPQSLPDAKESKRALSAMTVRCPQPSELGIDENERLLVGGERAARKRLRAFIESALPGYDEARDLLGEEGTSRLSQDLKFGTLSVKTAWWEAAGAPAGKGRDSFLNELLWREFAYATLWDRPQVLRTPYHRAFADFPYEGGDKEYVAWEKGQTGVPVVDASARQLLREGYVHNRARMVSASFLTKNLLVSYKRGEAHYMRYLTDGDWAANNMGWQWSAGCGVDAAPYFRVFNPVNQGKKFDGEGKYVRRYLPELRNLPNKYIHAPWEAPEHVLDAAGVKLGQNYPRPIVDLKESRKEFLDRAQSVLKRRA